MSDLDPARDREVCESYRRYPEAFQDDSFIGAMLASYIAEVERLRAENEKLREDRRKLWRWMALSTNDAAIVVFVAIVIAACRLAEIAR